MFGKYVPVSVVVLTAVKINRDDGKFWLERFDGKPWLAPHGGVPPRKPRKVGVSYYATQTTSSLLRLCSLKIISSIFLLFFYFLLNSVSLIESSENGFCRSKALFCACAPESTLARVEWASKSLEEEP